MTYEELINGIGGLLKLENFIPNDEGVCELISEEIKVVIRHSPETGMVLISTIFTELFEEDGPFVYRKLLSSNHFFYETKGATISVDENTGLVYLAQYFLLSTLEPQHLLDCIVVLINVARNLTDEIEKVRDSYTSHTKIPSDVITA